MLTSSMLVLVPASMLVYCDILIKRSMSSFVVLTTDYKNALKT